MHRSIFGVASLLFQLACGNVFPPPGGPFHVRWASSELIDDTRTDPFNSSHVRRLMVSRFTPVPRSLCSKESLVPYMSPAMGAVSNAMLEEIFPGADWPRDFLEQLQVEVCSEWAETDVEYPTLLFSPGFRGSRLLCTVVAQEIASMGYEVVVLDHPYEADLVEFPDGTAIARAAFFSNLTDPANLFRALEFAVEVRAADASFVLDALDVQDGEKVGYMGHSLGGASAATAMLNDSRIAAGANLDGSFWGPAITAGVSGPFLMWGSTGHNSSTDASWDTFFEATASRAWIKELSLNDSIHYSFFDIPIIGDVSGLRPSNPQLVDAVFGHVTGARVAEVLREYISDFFDFALGDKDEGLLGGPSAAYPDVLFLREGPEPEACDGAMHKRACTKIST